MAFAKSILRSLVEGGTQLDDERRLIDRLAEFAEKIGTNQQLALYGGLGQIGFGLLIATVNLSGLLAIALGGYCLTKIKPNTLTNADDRELRFLSKHRNIFGVLKRLKLRGADEEEILQSFEAMIARYDFASDQIILSPEHVIPAAHAIAGFEVVTAQIRNHDGETSQPMASPQKRSFLNESLKQSRQLPAAPIGMNTRLGAVEVPSAQSEASPVAVLDRMFHSEPAIGLPQELRQTMVDLPYSTFVIGMSGAGKDILVYNVVAEIRRRHPQAYLIGIDGKNAPEERPLWDNTIYNETIHFSMGDHPKTYHDRLLDIFDNVDRFPPMTLIVFSELNGTRNSYFSNGMGDKWQTIANKIRYIALQLNYAQKFIIATAQTANKEELGIGEGRQNVQFCLVSNGQQQSFINAVTKAAVFEGNAVKDTATWQSAISRSTALEHLPDAAQRGGIAYFHSALGRWLPMPRLHNVGGDRGIPGSMPQQPRSESPKTIEPPSEAPNSSSLLEKASRKELEETGNKGNTQKPILSRTELVLVIAELGEWLDKNPGLSFDQMYSNYNAHRKGFSRPQFRYLLIQIANLDS